MKQNIALNGERNYERGKFLLKRYSDGDGQRVNA